jgi:hypothetical protein
MGMREAISICIIACILTLGSISFLEQEASGFAFVFADADDITIPFDIQNQENQTPTVEDWTFDPDKEVRIPGIPDVVYTKLTMHSLVEGEVIAGGHIPDNSKLVTHPIGYFVPMPFELFTDVTVTVGIDPTSLNAAEMVTPVQNVIATWNGLMPTTGNIISGGANNIPPGMFDYV